MAQKQRNGMEKQNRRTSIVFYKDVNVFTERVQELRGYPSRENLLYKIYIDEGQSRLTVSMSIIQWMLPESEREQGRFKTSGVKRVFILASAPCKETYENVRLMIEKIGLDKFTLDWKLSADMKFINIYCGIGPHSSTFPCYVCTWRRGEDQPGVNRTFRVIKDI